MVSVAAVPMLMRKFLGHELVGEVIEVGENATGFSVGDKVILKIDFPSCYQRETDPMCHQCKKGDYLLCEKASAQGIPENQGGAFHPS